MTGSNVENLDRDMYLVGLSALEKRIGCNLKSAALFSVEIGKTFSVEKAPPSYLSEWIEAPRLKRCTHGKYETVSFVNGRRSISGYDKRIECKLRRMPPPEYPNALRIEYRVKNKLGQDLNISGMSPSRLGEQDIYKRLIAEWGRTYFSILKSSGGASVPFPRNVRELDNMLIAKGLAGIDLPQLFSEIRSNTASRAISAQSGSRLRKAIRAKAQSDYALPSTLASEVDGLVLEVLSQEGISLPQAKSRTFSSSTGNSSADPGSFDRWRTVDYDDNPLPRMGDMEKALEKRFISPNFQFLKDIDESLLMPAAQAERFIAEDPAVALAKLRLFAERAAKTAAAHLGIYVEEREEFVETLRNLSWRRAFDERLADLFHAIRKDGNQAVHAGYANASDALRDLRYAQRIAEWLYRVVRDPGFRAPPFVAPPPGGATEAIAAELSAARERIAELEREAAQARGETQAERSARIAAAAEKERIWEELSKALSLAAETEDSRRREAERYEEELARIRAKAPRADSEEAVKKTAAAMQASLGMDFDEAETRELIDAQLRAAGWEADSAKLRYSSGARPEKGMNKAIAEWPCAGGKRADYVLFKGLEAVAVVEAKRASKNVPSVLDQAASYARSVEYEGWEASGGPWEGHRVPFAFATNGRPYLAQLKEASGIWFRDLRKPGNHARPLEGWYSPDGLSGLLKIEVEAGEQRLDDFGFELDFPLRYYQKDAILAAEGAIRRGKRRALLAMATGTGKTKTCIALLYRLLASGLFRRALFLVDRTALGEQAAGAFKETKIRGLRSFAEDFGIREFGTGRPEPETRVTIATVQSLVRRLFDPEAADRPGVDDYDLIVVDEAHRGYLLDRELSDEELEFRSYDEYVSKYRRVLDYFDAVRIGLTATPAPQTTDIFGHPVHYYSYRQAVVDGYLVDHHPPIQIETELSRAGIHWNAGESVPVYRPDRGQIELFETPDELAFDVADFNRRVVTRPFNAAIAGYLADRLDPYGRRKTLVFCATDLHADIFVEELKKAFTERYGELPDETVRKITAAATEPLTQIRRFKNETLPNVAVTVDLLTTGIDVPQITALVFIRRVNSRILYEQMLGRATRLCEELGKDYFEIYDAVALYETMKDWTDMKPVAVNPNIGFAELIREITEADALPPAQAQAARKTALDQLKAKLRRKVRRMADTSRSAFQAKTGMSPEAFVEALAAAAPGEAAALLADHPHLGAWLDAEGTGNKVPLVISEHADKLVSAKRKYFIADNAQDYLELFKKYLQSHLNDIAALRAVTTKPSSLTRKDLKELLISLDEAGFAESSLRQAWQEATNQDIAASVIGYIRRQMLGDDLVPWDARVDAAVARLKATHSFLPPQLQWLDRIARQLKVELVVDRQVLDSGVFKKEGGGYNRINSIFKGELERTLGELAELLWRSPA